MPIVDRETSRASRSAAPPRYLSGRRLFTCKQGAKRNLLPELVLEEALLALLNHARHPEDRIQDVLAVTCSAKVRGPVSREKERVTAGIELLRAP